MKTSALNTMNFQRHSFKLCQTEMLLCGLAKV